MDFSTIGDCFNAAKLFLNDCKFTRVIKDIIESRLYTDVT